MTTKYIDDLAAAINDRKAFEASKSSANTSMQNTLDAIAKSASRVADVLAASNVDANLINKSERVNARMNVYAYEKVVNVAQFIAKSRALNHYTLAIIRAASALDTLSHKDCVSLASLSCKHNDTKREKQLSAHKYQKHVAPLTAATQSSSSINALQAFDVLRESRDDANNVIYKLNRDNATTQTLIALLQG